MCVWPLGQICRSTVRLGGTRATDSCLVSIKTLGLGHFSNLIFGCRLKKTDKIRCKLRYNHVVETRLNTIGKKNGI